MHITQAEEILNKNSGWKAMTGTTDFGVISGKAGTDEDKDGVYQLAFDLFVDRVLNYVGQYFIKLDGKVDALVFAGGIGEKGVELRKKVVEGVRCLGFEIDEESNKKPGTDVVVDISAKDAKFKTLICQTDEQLEMARGVVEERARLEKK
jgi:acetate kinase